jgi:hypothetical protein
LLFRPLSFKERAMARTRSADSTPRLRRSIVLCSIFVTASALGMILARPIAAQFHGAPPWLLPAIAIGVLAILVVVTLLALPRHTTTPPKPPT